MPIDPAMQFELADEWLTPYLDAERMTPSHPMREAAFAAADLGVYRSYETLDHLAMVAPYNSLQVCEAIAEDVVAILRGVAALIVSRERELAL